MHGSGSRKGLFFRIDPRQISAVFLQGLVIEWWQRSIKQREDISALRKDVGEDISALRKDVAEIKLELRYVWDDVKRIDNRLSAQDEQLASLKRLK